MDEPKGRSINDQLRGRDYLTPAEVKAVAEAAGKIGRHGHRDMSMIWVMFRHGLRVSELVNLRRSQIDLTEQRMHIKRLKKGRPATHPMVAEEIRALRRLFKESPDHQLAFVSERGGPLTPSAVAKIVERAGRVAKLDFPIHPHMLRHSCGYKLANDGRDTRSIQQWLGHGRIQNTVRYTELAAKRFEGFWED